MQSKTPHSDSTHLEHHLAVAYHLLGSVHLPRHILVANRVFAKAVVVDVVGEGVDPEFTHVPTAVGEEEVVLMPQQVLLTHLLDVRE